MNRRSGLCLALHLCGLLAWSAAGACTDPRVVAFFKDRMEFKHAVIRFEVIKVPARATAEVEGEVEVLVRAIRLPLRSGAPLDNGTKLRIAPCGKLILRFPDSGRIEFQPSLSERWLVLETATEGH
jgi:hypothetical protein